MAEQKEVEMLLSLTKPRDKNSVMTAFHKINTGISGALRCLYRAEPDTLLTATDLSNILGITSARTAAMLKKMTQMGYITKKRSPEDARMVYILLTEKGMAAAVNLRQQFLQMLSDAIDLIGVDKLSEFFNTLNRLCDEIAVPELLSIVNDV